MRNRLRHSMREPRPERPAFRTTSVVMQEAMRIADEKQWTLSVLFERAVIEYIERHNRKEARA